MQEAIAEMSEDMEFVKREIKSLKAVLASTGGREPTGGERRESRQVVNDMENMKGLGK